jgi:HJR/Mrr/RecB family endonuclease
LEQLKKYIDENNKTPSTIDKNIVIKQLGKWLGRQKTNYDKKTYIMQDKTIYDIWTKFINDVKYKQYFISNVGLWKQTLEQLKKYIDENNKTPSQTDKNIVIKQLGTWLGHQKTNYDKKTYIMQDKTIYDIWTKFINKYFT